MKKLPIPDVPRPRDIATDVADLEGKISRFAVSIRQLESERRDIVNRVHAGESTTSITPQNARVAALLGYAEIKPDSTDRERLSAIAIALADLRAATDLADRQRRVALTKASALIRDTIAPEYRNRVRAVVDALRVAHSATADLHLLTDALDDREVEWTALGVAFPSFLGHPTDVSGPLAYYLRELADQGHIEPREIPKELQPK